MCDDFIRRRWRESHGGSVMFHTVVVPVKDSGALGDDSVTEY